MSGKDTPRVLIEIRGGSAYVQSAGEVNICIVDYDNSPHAEIPENFSDLGDADVEVVVADEDLGG